MKNVRRGALLLVVLFTLFGTVAHAASYKYFPDVPDDARYAYEINLLKEAGIFSGDGAGNFNPNQTMTRAEAATIMLRLFVGDVEPSPSTGSFTDVASSHWAYGYIETAVKHGMIGGYGNGKFGPSDELTYEQAVTLLVKAMGYAEIAGELGGWPEGFLIVGGALDITEDTTNLSGNPVPRNTVAKLIYNACFRSPELEDDNINEVY